MHTRSSSDGTRGSHRIAATPPIFPSYLLPSFKFPFLRHRRRLSSSSSSSDLSSSPSSTSTTAAASRLSRLGPDTLRCTACSADLALAAQIISKGFTGRYGRALLVAPPSLSDEDAEQGRSSLLNIRVGRLENRQLVTGWHVVADISCGTCAKKLGWKYVDAKEKSQKYKVGKYILETERVMTYRSWGDGGGEPALAGGGLMKQDCGSSDAISFDSEDEDECDDIFAGTWDANAVAERRAQMIAAVRPEE